MNYILCDWKNNTRNIKARLILASYRICTLAKNSRFAFILLLPHLIMHRLLVEWILGVELPWKTEIGPGFIIYHGHALVINDGSKIGKNCTVRHCTSIGNKRNADLTFSKSPVIGDNVDIGSHVCIIGPITIGNNVIIGAGSIVVKDIPSNSIVVGNPARIIKSIES